MKSYLFRQKFDLVLTLMSISCVIIHSQAIAAGMEGMKLSLMPWPQTIELTRSEFRLDTSFRITMVGSAPDRLYAGATRALYRLQQRTGLTFGQGGFVTRDQSADSASMVIRCATAGKVELGVDESYALSVSNTRVELSAQTDIGALRGLETFLQLLSVDETGSYVPGVEIVDKPRFPWRGLLIDAGRHFMPVEVLTRNLDAMAAVKLNVLHLHLTEDQGFRIESKIYPRLHEMGSDGLYYTQVQIREIIDYAADRGIRVIPEFDVPGHTTSWLVGHPELGSAPGPYQIERHWGIKYPALNPVNEFTYEFLDNFFAEMGSLFPDPYFHIGGDEIEHGNYHEARHWNENPEIQAFKKKNNIADNFALQAYFNSRVLKILTGHGKVMVGWDEILHETMPTNIVIQSWRGRDSMVRAAEAGFQSILSNGYYIDLIYPASDHYTNDPLPADVSLTPEQQAKILGGEATMWSEYVSPETVDSRIWPRTAAIAERLWSAREVKDLQDMYRRLEAIDFQLEEHGLTHQKNYEMMLRRLVHNDKSGIELLRNLVDVIEPVKHYNRKPQPSYAPLTRVVDAARPDAPTARRFRDRVNSYLMSAGSDPAELTAWLHVWRDNHEKLLAVIRKAPALHEIESLSADLTAVAGIGLQALEHRKNGTRPAKWLEQSEAVLKNARKPRANVELMIVSAVEKLVASVK